MSINMPAYLREDNDSIPADMYISETAGLSHLESGSQSSNNFYLSPNQVSMAAPAPYEERTIERLPRQSVAALFEARVVQNKVASLQRDMSRSPRGSEIWEDRAEELLKAIVDCVHSDLLCVRKGMYEVGRRFSTKSTVGLMLSSTVVENLLIGSPALSSRQISKGDRIVKVDGLQVNEDNVHEALIGSDLPGSFVQLTLQTKDNKIKEVLLSRMSTQKLSRRKQMFEFLTTMKELALQTGLAQVDQVEEAARQWSASIEEDDEGLSEVVRNLSVLRKDVKVLVDELRAGLPQGRRTSGSDLDVDMARMEKEQLAGELRKLRQEKVNAEHKAKQEESLRVQAEQALASFVSPGRGGEDVGALRADLNNLQLANSEKAMSLKMAEADMDMMRSNHRQQLIALEQQLANLSREKERLEQDLRGGGPAAGNGSDQYMQQKMRSDNLEEELSRSRADLNKAKELGYKLEAEKQELEGELVHARDALDRSSIEIQNLQREIESLKRVTQKLRETKDDIIVAETSVEQERDEAIMRAARAEADAKRLAPMVDSLASKNRELKEEIAEQIRILATKDAELQQARQDYESCHGDLVSLEVARKSTINELELKSKELWRLESEVHQLINTRDDLNNKVVELREKIAADAAAYKISLSEIERLKSDLAITEERRLESIRYQSNMEADLESSLHTISDLRDDNEKLARDVSSRERVIKSQEDEISQLRMSTNAYKEQLDLMIDERNKLEYERNEVIEVQNKSLEWHKSELKRMERKIEILNQKLKTQADALKAAQNEITSKTNTLEEAESREERLGDELRNRDIEIKFKRDEMEKIYAELSGKLEKETKARIAAEKERDALLRETPMLEERAEQLEAEMRKRRTAEIERDTALALTSHASWRGRVQLEQKSRMASDMDKSTNSFSPSSKLTSPSSLQSPRLPSPMRSPRNSSLVDLRFASAGSKVKQGSDPFLFQDSRSLVSVSPRSVEKSPAKGGVGLALAQCGPTSFIVEQVIPGGAAWDSNEIRPGDIIHRVNGNRCHELQQLYEHVQGIEGTLVVFDMEQGGKQKTVTLTRKVTS